MVPVVVFVELLRLVFFLQLQMMMLPCFFNHRLYRAEDDFFFTRVSALVELSICQTSFLFFGGVVLQFLFYSTHYLHSSRQRYDVVCVMCILILSTISINLCNKVL